MVVIAIDGPTSSGKSTVARIVANRLGFSYVNSGLFYRTITYLVVNSDVSKIEDTAFIQTVLANNEFIYDNEQIICNGKNITSEVTNERLTRYLPIISTNSYVRSYVVLQIKLLSNSTNIVIDGRDIGTVVFPDATLKIYLDADVEVRAKRRYEEFKKQGFTYEEILDSLKKRDYLDMNREISPLAIAPDAYVINSTDLTIEENVSKIIELYREVI